MKKYRYYIAAAMCFAMLCSTGCSGKDSSSDKTSEPADTNASAANENTVSETTEPSTEPAPDIHANDGNMYQTLNFSFSVGDNVGYVNHEDTIHEDSDYFSIPDRRSFEFSSDLPGIEKMVVSDMMGTNYEPEFYMKSQEGIMAFDENGWTLSKNGDNDVALYCTSLNSNTGTCEAAAEVICQGKLLSIYAECKPEALESAKKIVSDAAFSAKYVGSYRFPTGEQSLDCEHFSVKCDLPWELTRSDNYYSEGAYIELFQINEYRQAPVSLEIHAFWDTQAGYICAKEFADEIHDSYKEKYSAINGKENFSGYDAYTVEFDKAYTHYTEHSKYWFFDHDGLIFEVIGSWETDDKEYEAEVMKLTDAIEIK